MPEGCFDILPLISPTVLRKVPTLDQCKVKVSNKFVMYAFIIQTQTINDEQVYDFSLEILDSHNYSSISTTDVVRSIYEVAVKKRRECQKLFWENQEIYESVSDSARQE